MRRPAAPSRAVSNERSATLIAETLLSLAETRGARVLTPLLGRPFVPARVEGPTPWWRAVGAEQMSETGAVVPSEA